MRTSITVLCLSYFPPQTTIRKSDVPQIKSAISPNSPAFKANAEAMGKLTAELKDKMATAALGGDEKSRKRHTERGKLLPRERVERLMDPGSTFLELSPLAAKAMY